MRSCSSSLLQEWKGPSLEDGLVRIADTWSVGKIYHRPVTKLVLLVSDFKVSCYGLKD